MWKLAATAVALVFVHGVASAQQSQNTADWIADSNGCKIWNPNPKPNETVTWSGACVGGFGSGAGVLQWFENGRAAEQLQGESPIRAVQYRHTLFTVDGWRGRPT